MLDGDQHQFPPPTRSADVRRDHRFRPHRPGAGDHALHPGGGDGAGVVGGSADPAARRGPGRNHPRPGRQAREPRWSTGPSPRTSTCARGLRRLAPPKHSRRPMASGQLARHLGLPWRSSGVNTSNAPDAQSAYETMINMFGALQGGANMIIHAAGWLESGLSASYEKFVLDVEMLQILAEAFLPIEVSEAEIGLDAIAGVAPGGHFFGGCPHSGALPVGFLRTAAVRPIKLRAMGRGGWVDRNGTSQPGLEGGPGRLRAAPDRQRGCQRPDRLRGTPAGRGRSPAPHLIALSFVRLAPEACRGEK